LKRWYGDIFGNISPRPVRPIAFFDNNKTGELVNRLGNDITMTSRVLIDASAGIRSSITALVGTCPSLKLGRRLSPVF